MLDVGAWCSFLSAVEKMHRGHRTDSKSLARTIVATWAAFDSSCFERVYKRWQKVLQLVIDDCGGNALVDTRSKELFCPMTLPGEYNLPEASDNSDKELEQEVEEIEES